MRPYVLALLILGAVVVVPAFATMGAQAHCPIPIVDVYDCPEGSSGVVYPRVCWGEMPQLCHLIP